MTQHSIEITEGEEGPVVHVTCPVRLRYDASLTAILDKVLVNPLHERYSEQRLPAGGYEVEITVRVRKA